MKQDFDQSLIDDVAHRPYPIPSGPWIMRQSWHNLLFAHWPLAATTLRPLVPDVLPLDTFDGAAWIGVVPFSMTDVTVRGIAPVPGLSAFAELNVRTYVSIDDRPGVFFFSLDAANAVAVGLARVLFGLPYYTADMHVAVNGQQIDYRSRRSNADPPVELVARYHPSGPPASPVPGTLEYWLTERYCLYTVDGDRVAHRLDIHHRPWALQPAEAVVTVNTMTAPLGLELPDMPPLVHFARRQDMIGWRPVKR